MEINSKNFKKNKYIFLNINLLKYCLNHKSFKFILLLLFNLLFFINLFWNINKIIIPLAYALNNEFTFPLIVSMTSVLYNANKNTFYIFYIMIPYDFLEENKNKIRGLNIKYINCKIIFLELKDKYKNWKIEGYYHISTYYRLSLSDLVTDFDKIIYLDCDTLIHKDLSEMFNLEMKDYYYMGIPNLEIAQMVINGTRNFIGAGVMLINLKELRKKKASNLFEDYYNIYGTKKNDEYLINVVFYNKIGFLPLKFGLPDFDKKGFTVKNFYKAFNGHLNINLQKFIIGSKNPTITHNCYTLNKWWTKDYNLLTNIGKKWIFYASKSNIFFDICQKYKQYKDICILIKN